MVHGEPGANLNSLDCISKGCLQNLVRAIKDQAQRELSFAEGVAKPCGRFVRIHSLERAQGQSDGFRDLELLGAAGLCVVFFGEVERNFTRGKADVLAELGARGDRDARCNLKQIGGAGLYHLQEVILQKVGKGVLGMASLRKLCPFLPFRGVRKGELSAIKTPAGHKRLAFVAVNATMPIKDCSYDALGDACLMDLHARVEALEQRPIPGTAELAADHFVGANKMVPTPEAAPVATDAELLEVAEERFPYSLRSCYDLGRQHGAAQPPAAQPAQPAAPAGGLVELVATAIIREVAAWMRKNEVGYNAARWLEQEAGR